MRTPITWQGIEIEITYAEQWYNITDIAHLEIQADEPLPMTETGYRSHFTQAESIEAHGGAVAFVREWLESEAQSPAWQKYLVERQQLSLF